MSIQGCSTRKLPSHCAAVRARVPETGPIRRQDGAVRCPMGADAHCERVGALGGALGVGLEELIGFRRTKPISVACGWLRMRRVRGLYGVRSAEAAGGMTEEDGVAGAESVVESAQVATPTDGGDSTATVGSSTRRRRGWTVYESVRPAERFGEGSRRGEAFGLQVAEQAEGASRSGGRRYSSATGARWGPRI